MKFEGEHRIAAAREVVFSALNSPDALKHAIPGCERLVKVSDTEMEATVIARVGPVKAPFSGSCTLSNVIPPQSYLLTGEGKGAASMGRCKAAVNLKADGDETLLTYEFTAEVSGKLAQIGSRLVESSARKLANDFFETFSANIVGEDLKPASAKERSASLTIIWKLAAALCALLATFWYFSGA
ncbi:carbon monoxide dehydrogenase subunit G [Pseudomaricurvus alkylphenolicus]|uniref:SRPBCC family protein n=1 Tax=Pseudomaricurvus alkylphenolicus TaxID=1306991 RepID=UPI001422DF5B|nr:carbon monoxide dehydrogenase subunit G [Pseudomaricurvus alkylphenolicus]NIB40847.1 carbon monoxide dehydrogenase subunit G [Pseudomaricurvus alkylphenolicus]